VELVLRTVIRIALALAASGVTLASAQPGAASTAQGVRIWAIRYRSHTGVVRSAYVVLPSWYGPRRHPRIPLIISPHGRGVNGRANTRLWGRLPAVGPFAVVNPNGQGDRLELFSWGAPGEVADLARMPRIVEYALPWLRINPRRVYAFGGSMGGQETLLLLASHPSLLAGAAAFDAVADLASQYRNFPLLRCNRLCLRRWDKPIGLGLQHLVRIEVGGRPARLPGAYARRSPLAAAGAIAASCVPLQLWWSRNDKVVVHPWQQSERLFWSIRHRNPTAAVEAFAGSWRHTAEFRASSLLPVALARFGLLPRASIRRHEHAQHIPTPGERCRP
jgi:pimeloyl-ACP methyl ester carboxylesterase